MMTEAQASSIENLPPTKHPQREVKQKLRDQWKKLAKVVTELYGDSYKPAAKYLEELCRGDMHNNSGLENIPWLTQNVVRFDGAPAFNLHKCVMDALAPAAPLKAVWARRQA